jgi:polyketide synthase 12/epothilone polyketide synthase D
MKSELSVFDSTGNAMSVAAGRVSYTFGLQGPCLAIDTACSSSLVALHNACKSLQHNECSLAILSGVNLISSHASKLFALAGMTSADGHCHSFDEGIPHEGNYGSWLEKKKSR